MAVDYETLHQLIGQRGLETLKARLTVTHHKRMGKEILSSVIMRLYKFIDIEVGKKSRRILLVARWAGIGTMIKKINNAINIKFNCTIADGTAIDTTKFEPGVEMDDNQQVVIDYLMNNIYTPKKIQQGSAGCVLVMATGLGKSYVAMQMVENIHKKTLVVLPNTSMLGDWLGILNTYFPQLRVGQYHKDIKCDGDIVFTTINSAVSPVFKIGKSKIPYHQYFKQFGLVIYDEIHNYPTKKFVEVFWRAGVQCVLGLTATPNERDDGMDVIYPKHAGPLVIAKELPGYNVAEIPWKGEVEVIYYHGHPDYTNKITNVKGWTKTSAMHEQFLNDPYRNKLILDRIKKLRQEGKFVFAYCERREYLPNLQDMIGKAGLTSDAPEMPTKTDKMLGGITPEEKIKAAEADIILMTYGYGKEGISIKKMNSMLFATPRRKKMRQILGRILRRGGDPSIVRHIIDIVDVDTPLRDQYRDRYAVYEEKKFDVYESEISWKEISL